MIVRIALLGWLLVGSTGGCVRYLAAPSAAVDGAADAADATRELDHSVESARGDGLPGADDAPAPQDAGADAKMDVAGVDVKADTGVDAAVDLAQDTGADAAADTGADAAADTGADAAADTGADAAADLAQDTSAGDADVDAAPPGSVACGTLVCKTNETCCWRTLQASYSCDTSCGMLATAIRCDGPEDCPGEICCFEFSGVQCGASCTGPTVCSAAADCPPGQAHCCPSGLGDLLVCTSSAC